MANRNPPFKRANVDYDIPDIDDEKTEEKSELMFDEFSSVENMLSELGEIDGVSINIYRQQGSGTQRQEYLFQVPADGTDLGELFDRISHEYGHGKYCLWFRSGGRVIGKRTIAIAANSRPKQELIRQESTADILRAIQEMTQKSEQNMAAVLQSIMNNRPDPMAQFQQMMAMMASVKDIFGVGQSQHQPVLPPQKTPIEQLKEMLEVQSLMKEMAADSTGESSILERALMKFGDPLIEIVKQSKANEEIKKRTQQVKATVNPQEALKLAQKNADQSQLMGHAPSLMPVPPMSELPSQPESKEMGLLDQLKQKMHPMAGHVNTLLALAKENEDPIGVAELVLDHTPESMHEQILDMIEKGTLMDEIISINPESEPYRDWFYRVFDAILREFSDENDGLTASNVMGNADENPSSEVASDVFVPSENGDI